MGGTGKTEYIEKLCRKELKKGNMNVHYLTFNRKTAEKASVRLQGFPCSTIHSLAYQELKYFNALPQSFIKNDDQDDPDSLTEREFNQLLKIFCKHFKDPNNVFYSLTDDLILIVDEYQNNFPELKAVIQLIARKIRIKELYLVGDRLQYIYDYKFKDLKNFECIDDYFNHVIDQRLFLDRNYRSAPHIQHVINSFVTKSLNVFIYR